MTTTNWIVDVEVGPEQAPQCAHKVTQWLIQEGIVLPTPPEPTDVFLVSSPCYPKHLLAPGPKALEWCSFSNQFGIFSGIQIVKEKRVFDPGGNFSDIIQCPSCSSKFDSGKLKWMDAIDGWWSRDDGSLTCPACKSTRDIGRWIFPDSHWAFGYLGFGFAEWSVDERMATAISSVLRHKCVFVCSHI